MSTIRLVNIHQFVNIGLCPPKNFIDMWSFNAAIPDAHYIVTVQTPLNRSKTVFLADWSRRRGDDDDGRNAKSEGVIVVKFGGQDAAYSRLEYESKAYEKLQHLQGSVVPNVYGLYKSKVQRQTVGCLLMEYCPQDLFFERQTNELAYAALQLHLSGLCHGGLSDLKHVRRDNQGNIRIIDFANCFEHRCAGIAYGTQCGCSELTAIQNLALPIHQQLPPRVRHGSHVGSSRHRH
ncbi:hypothetical protein D9758_000564 [Tetrapyrgos nigripes]|uniref:Protein kinase domain-containing protein n=1 Tax=Tetrapyrgos nigripes TaxID=182062 RepID=A0A8H5LZ28_9AGAR|nr:hypothetical protein D9758_000564 [Tetrapyrgos nigripes]